MKLGIGMVFQNFRLVQTLTAAENIVLGEVVFILARTALAAREVGGNRGDFEAFWAAVSRRSAHLAVICWRTAASRDCEDALSGSGFYYFG